jgi:hypothetical protein
VRQKLNHEHRVEEEGEASSPKQFARAEDKQGARFAAGKTTHFGEIPISRLQQLGHFFPLRRRWKTRAGQG